MANDETADRAIRLVPALEMEPMRYAAAGRTYPAADASPDDWDQFWASCLADAGVTGLQPIRPRSWLVPVAQLTDADVLHRILWANGFSNADDEGPEDAETRGDPDNYIAFSGGLVLMVGGTIAVTPRCCGDLSDIRNWQSAAAHRTAEPLTLWIGHPFLRVRFDGDRLLFTEEKGSAPEWRGVFPGDLTLEPAKLQDAVAQARTELNAFARRLLPGVQALIASPHAARIAEILAAGHLFPRIGELAS